MRYLPVSLLLFLLTFFLLGEAGNTVAQTALTNIPADIKNHSSRVADFDSSGMPAWIFNPGSYIANNTAAYENLITVPMFDAEILVIDTETTLTSQASGRSGGVSSSNVGLALDAALVVMNGGTLNATGSNDAVGLAIMRDSFFIDRATLNAKGDGGEFGSVGMTIFNGDFNASRSLIRASGSNGSSGVYVRDAYIPGSNQKFFYAENSLIIADASGGPESRGIKSMVSANIINSEMYLTASGVNNVAFETGAPPNWPGNDGNTYNGYFYNDNTLISVKADDNAIGLSVPDGYEQYSGLLILEAGTGMTMAAGYAYFDLHSTLVVQFDAADPAKTGRMYIDGKTINGTDYGLLIDDGAVIDVDIQNASSLKTGGSLEVQWLDVPLDGSGVPLISGAFTAIKSLRNFDLGYDPGTGILTITRVRTPSDSLTGNNARVVRGLENGVSGNAATPGYEAANALYDLFDNANDVTAMNDIARRTSGWQSTKFAGMMFSNIDLEQNTLYNQLAMMRTDIYYESLAHSTLLGQAGDKRVNPWTRWIAWNGNVGNFGGETASFDSLKADSCSVDLGMARRIPLFGKGSFLGFNLGYNYGKFRDGNKSRDRGYTSGEYKGFSAIASARTDFTKRNFWLDTTIGLSVADFEMSRRDYLGGVHDSDTAAGIFRLGWAVGRDYGLRTHEYYFYYEHCRFTPILGLDYTLYLQDGLQEGNKTNGLALKGNGDSMHSLRGKAGLEFAYCYTDLSLSLHSFLRWEFFDDRLKLPTHFSTAPEVMYDLTAQPVGGISGVLGLNLNWQLFENQDVGLAYDGIYGDHYNTHWFNLRYVRRF